MSDSDSTPSICIIGAGLSGLVLASILHKHGLQATIFERDDSKDSRGHLGGNLDMHEESGLRAIVACGLESAFKGASLPDGEEMYIMEKTGEVLWHDMGHEELGGPGRPEIDRTVLRHLLIASIPPTWIKWGHAFVSAAPLEEGRHLVTFQNGTQVTSSLLVGADGMWSKVRALVSQEIPSFSGWSGVEISLSPETVASRPDISGRVGKGTFMCLGDGDENLHPSPRSLNTQLQADGRLRCYAWIVSDSDSDDFALPSDPTEAKEKLLAEYEGWPTFLRDFIKLSDPDRIYPRPLYALPVGHKWKSVAGVTLIGDSAHGLVPFAGEGANQSMADGLDLGLALATTPPAAWGAAITDFEGVMFARGEEAARESEVNSLMFKRADAAQVFAKWMKDAFAAPPPEPATK